jgi:hypothetical protein
MEKIQSYTLNLVEILSLYQETIARSHNTHLVSGSDASMAAVRKLVVLLDGNVPVRCDAECSEASVAPSMAYHNAAYPRSTRMRSRAEY